MIARLINGELNYHYYQSLTIAVLDITIFSFSALHSKQKVEIC